MTTTEAIVGIVAVALILVRIRTFVERTDYGLVRLDQLLTPPRTRAGEGDDAGTRRFRES